LANDNFDVFISYSSVNKNIADAIVSEFEGHNIKCWYAPRDIMPGEEWVSAITGALETCKILVLVYTDESNSSRQVMNEVAVAFNAGKTIVPFRLTKNKMSSEFEYYLTRVHWLDAVTPPLKERIENLREYVDIILSGVDTSNLSRNAVERKKPEINKKKSKKKVIIPAIIAGALLLIAALFLVVGISVFAIVGIGGSGKRNLKKGIDYYYSEYQSSADNEAARGYFEKAAKKGKGDAYYYLGMLDEREYDFNSAKENYEKGVDKGSDLSRLELGNLYENGLGVYPDLVKAISLYDESIAKGSLEGYCFEGNFYMSGYLNYEGEFDKAYEYLNKAKESEIKDVAADAYIDLGYMYESGEYGIEKDYDKALSYYKKAMELKPGLTGICNNYMAEIYLSQDDTVNSDIYYKKAMDYFRESADAGNIESMNWMGYYYHYGIGCEIDYEKAMDYYRKAADMNIPDSFCNIGYLYEYGSGNVKQDYDKAYEWFKKAADMDYSEAMRAIGDMYFKGEYAPKADGTPDYNTARTWYEKALEAGYIGAYKSLGYMYEYGLGANEDYDKAYELFLKNAEFGDSDAMFEIGNMYDAGYLSSASADDAMTWYLRAAKYGSTDAMVKIGNLYSDREDSQKAKEWYMAAASKNDASAMITLGLAYYYGNFDGIPDYENAYKWIKKASEAGDSTATVLMANMSMDGLGTKKDREAARQLFEKTVEDGTADAYVYYALGRIYEENVQVKKDFAKALGYYEKAADEGLDLACEKLGDMYFDGIGVNQDYSEAIYYYQKAVDNGNASGNVYKKLGDIYHYGYGVTSNDNIALPYYVKAADTGMEDAELFGNLGRLYYWEADYKSSALYFGKAADLGLNPEEMYNAGCAYYTLGDFKTALTWFGKALEYNFDRSDNLKKDIEDMVSAGLITEEEAAPYLN